MFAFLDHHLLVAILHAVTNSISQLPTAFVFPTASTSTPHVMPQHIPTPIPSHLVVDNIAVNFRCSMYFQLTPFIYNEKPQL